MKKIITLIAACIIAASVAGCSENGKTENSTVPENSAHTSENQFNVSSPLEILETVWKSYGENDIFPAAGGDFSEENSKMDAPGRYSVEDADALDSALAFPAASAGKIEDAASLVHMMNANTFTAAVFKVKEGTDASSVASEIKSNIDSRQWMCGMPDKMVIAVCENYVAVVFGERSLADTFKEKLISSFPSFSVTADADITV